MRLSCAVAAAVEAGAGAGAGAAAAAAAVDVHVVSFGVVASSRMFSLAQTRSEAGGALAVRKWLELMCFAHSSASACHPSSCNRY
jgi:hypothetical protein